MFYSNYLVVFLTKPTYVYIVNSNIGSNCWLGHYFHFFLSSTAYAKIIYTQPENIQRLSWLPLTPGRMAADTLCKT